MRNDAGMREQAPLTEADPTSVARDRCARLDVLVDVLREALVFGTVHRSVVGPGHAGETSNHPATLVNGWHHETNPLRLAASESCRS
jgi:hypothetical protein